MSGSSASKNKSCAITTLAEASVKGEKVTAENYPNADFNGDGKVTAADAAAIAKYLAEQSIKK